MTPEEKANELVLKYLRLKRHKIFNGWWHKMISKQCALIAVDELIDQCWSYREIDLGMSLEYWQEVKQEIEKL